MQHRRCNPRLQVMAPLVLVATLLTACGGAPAPGQRSAEQPPAQAERAFSVSGAFALFPIMTLWVEEYSQDHPDVRFDVQAGGAGKGMTDMLSGAADIAMLSREPRQEELDQGAYAVPVTIDAVLGTVNANNPYLAELQAQGLTPEQAHAIWITGEITTWGQLLGTDAADPINVYTRSDAAGAAEMWAKYALGEAQEELQGTAVNADPGLAEAVRQDPLSIGYNNSGFAYDPASKAPIAGLAVVPMDLDGDGAVSAEENFYANRDSLQAAIGDGHFPFPPARVLYLVTKGEPDPAIRDFYRWVLAEGQAFATDAGFVPLNEEQLAAARALAGEE